jgi:hypothetical protein
MVVFGMAVQDAGTFPKLIKRIGRKKLVATANGINDIPASCGNKDLK